jgi:hypothetical protein
MPFPHVRQALHVVAAAGISALLAACGSGNTPTTAAGVGTVNTNAYALNGTFQYPQFPPANGAESFDISFVDPSVHQYYLADRTQNGVSVYDTQTVGLLRVAGQGKFSGFKPNNPGPPSNAGPNGIVPVGGGIVFAGDGDSSMKVVNVNTGALLATIFPTNPYTGAPLPIAGGGATCTATTNVNNGNQRMDEMAYDPTDSVVIGINDASCPPFATFFSSKAPYSILGSLAFTTADGGAEQPVWDPAQGKFLQALPSTLANQGGEIDVIDPKTFALTKTIPEANCNANGVALGKNETLFLGCSGKAQILTINAVTGATINTISGLGGCDEAWYNPTADRFYAACSNNASGPVLVVADGNGALITSIATSPGAHSVAVDPTNDHIFFPTQKLGLQVYTH